MFILRHLKINIVTHQRTHQYCAQNMYYPYTKTSEHILLFCLIHLTYIIIQNEAYKLRLTFSKPIPIRSHRFKCVHKTRAIAEFAKQIRRSQILNIYFLVSIIVFINQYLGYNIESQLDQYILTYIQTLNICFSIAPNSIKNIYKPP